MKRVLALLSLPLASCVHVPELPLGPEGELITFDVGRGPFCGDCLTFKLAVASDGRAWMQTGWWAGKYSDWQTSTRAWRITPDQYAKFRALLAPYRPKGEQHLFCSNDGGDVSVKWRGGGPDGMLLYQFGCGEPNEMQQAFSTAPRELGLKYLPGWDEPPKS